MKGFRFLGMDYPSVLHYFTLTGVEKLRCWIKALFSGNAVSESSAMHFYLKRAHSVILDYYCDLSREHSLKRKRQRRLLASPKPTFDEVTDLSLMDHGNHDFLNTSSDWTGGDVWIDPEEQLSMINMEADTKSRLALLEVIDNAHYRLCFPMQTQN